MIHTPNEIRDRLQAASLRLADMGLAEDEPPPPTTPRIDAEGMTTVADAMALAFADMPPAQLVKAVDALRSGLAD